jgi:hypothetical protein
MGTIVSKRRPSRSTEDVRRTVWERVKEAMRRDWMETTHDLGLGGQEMNQSLIDTVKQALGQDNLPAPNEANSPTRRPNTRVSSALAGSSGAADARARAHWRANRT